MSTAPLLSRHLGDYLLIASLSEDALGSVFRALHAADERRFVRLRILRSAELTPEAIEAAIRENAARSAMLAHPAIVDRTLFDVVDEVPFMTWDETAGWTLDTLLSRVRAFGIRIPAEYALLIAERIAAALEHAHRTIWEGRPVPHGLLWPGFVSISHDAAVRVGGFGLAEGVVSSLSKPRMSVEVAPYLAPETRSDGTIDPGADVYALGMILAELLTGRRPTVDAPPPELRAGDPRSDELETFLHRCVAPRAKRFASAVDAHREIQRMVTGNPFSLYTANLALFLYKLLNPESQVAAPTSNWESTNPVVLDGSSRIGPKSEPSAPPADPAPAADTELAEKIEQTGESLWAASTEAPAAESAPVEAAANDRDVPTRVGFEDGEDDAEITAAIASIEPVETPIELAAAIQFLAAVEALDAEPEGQARNSEPEVAVRNAEPQVEVRGATPEVTERISVPEFTERIVVPEVPARRTEPKALPSVVDRVEEPVVVVAPLRAALDGEASGVIFRFSKDETFSKEETRAHVSPTPVSESQDRTPSLPELPIEVPVEPVGTTAWTRPAAALAAAAGLTVGAFLLISQFHVSSSMPVVTVRPRRAPLAQAPVPAAVGQEPQPQASVLPPVEVAPPPGISVASAAPVAVVLSGATGRVETARLRPEAASLRTSKPAPPTSRQPAEDLRLRAALARIEADRVNAQQTAGDLFGEGRHNEQEGERLLRERDYQAAELAFSRAARLFQQAQELSWQQRLRDANLSSAQ